MLRYAESPETLLADIAEEISRVRDPRGRHWLVTPGRGRAEHILNEWSRRTGIASHSQEIPLRTLLEQISAGNGECFDFDGLRVAVANALSRLADHKKFPLSKGASLAPITASVFSWATTLARAIDETLQCRDAQSAWEEDSFLEALVRDAGVARALERHPSLLSDAAFVEAALQWVDSWESKGGVPHLWVQLDSGLPALLFSRLLQTVAFFSKKGLSDRLRLFAIMPSAEYWGEQLIRSRNRSAGLPVPGEERHPGGLLWAFGRCSQDFQSQIIEPLLSEGSGGEEIPSLPCPDSLLGKLQESCRRSAQPENPYLLQEDDFSLTIHSAHNRLRELEVCRDRILQALEELPDLRLEEVLVLLANPKEQAAYVEAAFGGVGEGNLPFRLSGFGQAIASPFATVLKQLLKMLGGRLSLADIEKLLEHPLVARRFDLDIAEGEPKQIVSWLREAGFRWGMNSAHRRRLHAFDEHRWNLSWALQRLALGGVVAEDLRQTVLGESFQKFPTVPLERAAGLSLAPLAKLAAFQAALEKAQPNWIPGVERTLPEWNCSLVELITDLLDIDHPSAAAHAATLRNSILPALQKTGAESLQIETSGYVRLLEEKLENLNDSASRGGGGVRVGDLRQMCGVPARLVVVAGLDCESFPRKEERPAWHPLMGAARPGDPSIRDADRHALLMALISARERLVLSFCGGSDEDQKERPPSTALADILEAIDSLAQAGDAHTRAHHAILHRHPLNGFSTRAFARNLPSCASGRNPSDFRAALHLLGRQALMPYPGPWATILPEDESDIPSLENLRTLLREPARLFLGRLGIKPPGQAHKSAQRDLIELDTLENWTLVDEILLARLEGADEVALKRRLAVAGRIPRGELGAAILKKIEEELPATDPYGPGERVAAYCRIELPGAHALGVPVVLEGLPRPGWYRREGGADLFFYSASKHKPSPWKHDFSLRVDALAIVSTEAENSPQKIGTPVQPGQITGVFKDVNVSIPTPSPESAKSHLAKLLPLYRLARRVALPFWPGASHEIKARPNTSPVEIQAQLEDALQKWRSPNYGSGAPPECQSWTSRVAFRGLEDPMNWNPAVDAAFLPDPGAPLAWRLARFLGEWLEGLPR